jgi:hypothetical protein
VKAGRLKVLDATCPAVYAGLQAGAKGQPFAPLRGLIGSDLLRHRARLPRHRQPLAAAGDRDRRGAGHQHRCGLFHAALADAEGNVWIGRDRDRLLAAHAANTVLVTVERRVPGSFFDDEAAAAGTMPAAYMTRWLVPGGCWPMDADGRTDLAAVRRYQQAALSDDGFADYLRTEVFGMWWPAPGHRHDGPGRRRARARRALRQRHCRPAGRRAAGGRGHAVAHPRHRRAAGACSGSGGPPPCACPCWAAGSTTASPTAAPSCSTWPGAASIDAFFLSGGQIDGQANINLVGTGDYPQHRGALVGLVRLGLPVLHGAAGASCSAGNTAAARWCGRWISSARRAGPSPVCTARAGRSR